jgi:hypothetical protein
VGNVQSARDAGADHEIPFPAPVTIGWRPTCSHPLFPQKPPIPCTVLDPFSGSATTGVVSEKLGRDSILIDASEEYCTMARFRLNALPRSAHDESRLTGTAEKSADTKDS